MEARIVFSSVALLEEVKSCSSCALPLRASLEEEEEDVEERPSSRPCSADPVADRVLEVVADLRGQVRQRMTVTGTAMTQMRKRVA